MGKRGICRSEKVSNEICYSLQSRWSRSNKKSWARYSCTFDESNWEGNRLVFVIKAPHAVDVIQLSALVSLHWIDTQSQ